MKGLGHDFTVIEATGIKGIRDVISKPRVITGYVKVNGIGMVPYEGPLERDFLEINDFRRHLSYVGSQPLQITSTADRRNRYTPDYLVRYTAKPQQQARPPRLIEIKPRATLREEWAKLRPGFLRAALLCRERGWRFRIATDRIIRTPRLANIKFLRSYLDRRDDKAIGQILYLTLEKLQVTTPSELLAASFHSRDRRFEAVAILWKLVADGRIRVDLTKPLTMETTIWSIWHGRR